MSEQVFVVGAKRTPFGSLNGMFAEIEATQLGAAAMRGALAAAGIDGTNVDEVIVGQVLSGGCGQAPARQAMRAAGIPDSAHALTINKVCGSGLKSVMLGTDSIRLGESKVVVAGGMENMSMAPYFLRKARSGYRMGHSQLLDLMIYDGLQDPSTGRHTGEIGEESAAAGNITREAQDAFATRSYDRARAAIKRGLFVDEILPFVKKGRKGDEIIDTDEEPFRGDISKLPQLRPAFQKDGTITAGNASTISDGSAMLVLAGEAAVKANGLVPRARILASATESRHPDNFPEAPVGAIEKVCRRAGLSLSDIDLFEINEAFSTVPLLAINALGLSLDKVNVNGGACAIGHPIGASGARIAITLINELHRSGKRYGLATLCIGGGEAVAVIFERI
ncbi:MAG: thiolase family protein [Chlorobium sp.]